MSIIYSNQIAQSDIVGRKSLSIGFNGVFNAIIGAAEGGTLYAGSFVKLTTSGTGAMPNVLAAGQADIAFGVILTNHVGASFVAGDTVEVGVFAGPVVIMQAAGTIDGGAYVESDETGLKVQAYTTNPIRGFALTNAVTDQLFPVLLTNPGNFVVPA